MTASLTLDDGRRVIIRPVRPQDAAATGSFVERGLSPASRRRRFHGAIRSLPPALLKALTQADQISHVAPAAESVEGDDVACGTTVIVAEARYVVEPPGDQAEIMSSVAALRPGDWVQLAIADSATDRLIGDVGLYVDPDETRHSRSSRHKSIWIVWKVNSCACRSASHALFGSSTCLRSQRSSNVCRCSEDTFAVSWDSQASANVSTRPSDWQTSIAGRSPLMVAGMPPSPLAKR